MYFPWTVVVATLALGVGLTVASVLGISDVLRTDILIALRHVEPPAQSRGFMIVCRPPNDVARGMALGLGMFLLGGVPAAILGMALSRRHQRRSRHWSGVRSNVLFAALVFQLCSLMATALVLLLLLAAAYDSLAGPDVVVLGGTVVVSLACFGGALAASLACGVWGLRSWRALQSTRPAAPITILLR